jgi:membrane carboxypeptidase/penicillin-binding protein PbpC
MEEWIPDDSGADSCDWHRVTPHGVVVRWPAAYQEWAASQDLLNVAFAMPRLASTSRLPSPAVNGSAERQSMSNTGLRVLSPPDGAVYLIDPTLRREFQTIGLRGATDGVAPLEWQVDDTLVGTIAPDASLNWQLTPGHHVISARDPRGRSASASIVVK